VKKDDSSIGSERVAKLQPLHHVLRIRQHLGPDLLASGKCNGSGLIFFERRRTIAAPAASYH
jgi:hypothetical protein